LIVQIIFTIAENIAVSRKADNLYPYLKYKSVHKLDKETYSEIKRNTAAMIFHKIGSVLVMGTDNLLISKFVGIVAIGLYSNYLLIISSLSTFYGLVFQSVTASIGNLGVTESEDRAHFIFRCLNLVGFWLYGFSAICLINLFNPFIELWLGKEYLFSISLVLVIVINFYLTGMRRSVTTYKDALGLYWQDRYKPIFESIINLTISIVLVKEYGVIGVFIGTVISTLTTCFWIEPYVLFKHGFHKSAKNYFVRYILYTLVMLLAGIVTWIFTNMIQDGSVSSFIIKTFICIIIPNVVFIIAFYKTPEFKYLVGILKSFNKKVKLIK
jgi:O-antigen/teichoic acid export membrane protein